MKTILCFVCAVLFSSFALGQEGQEGKRIDLQLGIGTIHGEQRKDGKPWNQVNPGIAGQYAFPGAMFGKDVEYYVTAGEIKNSEFGQTVFAGGGVRKDVFEGTLGKISISAFAGGMTYPSRYVSGGSGKLFVAVVPTVSACLKNGGMCLDVTYLPAFQKDGGEKSPALLFAARFPLKSW